MSWDILPKSNLQYFLTKLKGIFDNKVDKETGKGLFSGAYADLSGKPDLTVYMQKGVDYVTAGKKSGTTLGTQATAEGGDVTASGNYCHAEGELTTATEEGAHVEGLYNNATGRGAHAEGISTNATNIAAHTEGDQTSVSSPGGHAEGGGTTTNGNYGHAEGYFTQAIGNSSHAQGYYTKTKARRSHAEGGYTIANAEYQHVEGKYNVEDTNGTYAHIIGGGTSDSARKNIFTVDWNGVARDGTENRLLPFKAVSEAEYAALSQAEKTNGTAYFRYEANGIMREIQDNGSATSLTSGALPTGQTITSFLNSNFAKCYYNNNYSGDANNLDAYETALVSCVTSRTTNLPTTADTNWYNVFSMRFNGNSNYVVQVAFKINNTSIHIRNKAGSTWSAWRTI